MRFAVRIADETWKRGERRLFQPGGVFMPGNLSRFASFVNPLIGLTR